MGVQLATLQVSTTAIDQYIRQVSSVPLLSASEEKVLAARFREEGDLQAARQLVLSNLRFVVFVTKGYLGYGLPQNDLIQEGNIGLMKAVNRFDPVQGVRLISFAVHWIRAEIHEFILKNWRIVKIATTKAQRKLFFNLRQAKKRLGWLNQMEIENVAKLLAVSPSEVHEMEQRLEANDTPFDLPSTIEPNHSLVPAQYLKDERYNPEKIVTEAEWDVDREKQLFTALSTLDDRSRLIVQKRWLADKKTTLQELAETYQVSVERIRQIETQAFKKLKERIRA